ncbi:MAG TPA: UDP-glucose/GDP-mannose dehydrogenase family protein [Candidatus Peribacteraceae bacterium]|nr:UDP-glucose/GDP-mannose dehydrogenase family protein [Candidatus Peribacteraceae bacterium]
MTIAVIGTGYVGLVSAACFAELGHTVWGVDIDEKKIEMLRQGKSPIFEPGLEELIRQGLENGRLRFETDLTKILPDVEIVFSAVATPPGEGHKADLRAVFTVAETVAKHAEQDIIFVNKSTVPVGTGAKCEERMAAILSERGKKFTIPVISNPEFLREGMAVPDTMMPERIVVGINGAKKSEDRNQRTDKKDSASTDFSSLTSDNSINARALMEELYRPITRVGKPLVFMSRESAEIVKYASNAFLATKISFINMLTELTEKTGGNIRDVATGMGLDSRIGPRFLHAGIGYGGSCFPKDVKALMATAKEYGVSMPIVEATDSVNTHQRKRFIDLILKNTPAKSRIAIWGLSFKPKTDDMRESPSLDVIPSLLESGHEVIAFDPAAMDRAKGLLPEHVTYTESPMEAVSGVDALVVLTEWDVFRGLDLQDVKGVMRGNLLFDGRNVYEPREVKEAGLEYFGIGIG